MCATGSLGQIREKLLIHKLLELVHLVQLNSDGLLLVFVLLYQDVIVQFPSIKQLLVAYLWLDSQLILIIQLEQFDIVLGDQEIGLVDSLLLL